MGKSIQKNSKKDQKYGQIMGINVFSTSINKVLTSVSKLLSDSDLSKQNPYKFSIVTPNPELVLMATKNIQLKEALNSADFPIPDGVGLNYAYKYLFGQGLNIIPGRILFEKLIELADQKKWRVFFLGGKDNEASKAADQLRLKYKSIKIKTFRGPILDTNAVGFTENNRKLLSDALKLINRYRPHILFVAFGNPKQEIWVYKNLSNLNVGGAMSVGGTFRYVAGLSQLPPSWVSNMGFEWLFRLIMEPHRTIRIINAVIIFPLKVFSYKMKQTAI